MTVNQKNGKGIMMNMLSVLKLIVALFFLPILPAQVYALTPAQVFDKVKDSIVVVKTLDNQGKVKGQGSGVLISSGRVATNCHVVEGGASYQVGWGKQFVPTTLYAEDGEKDICLLDAKGLEGKPAQIGKAAGLKVGDPVYAVGAPRGLELSLSDGIVAQLRGGLPPLIQTTAAISPGSSGGGLFDREGRLVGLTTLYLEGGQSLNFAIPVEWIGEVKPGRKLAAEGFGQAEWCKRAIALENMKDWKGLLDWCRRWTKSLPKDEDAWFSLGIAYTELERYDDAIDAYLQAMRVNPDSAIIWYNLGTAYDKLKQYKVAIVAYRQAIKINTENADAWCNLGADFANLNRYEDAIDAFRKALRINPEFANSWKNLGVIYNNLERYNIAIDAFRQALRINPEYADAWFGLGAAYIKLKRYNEAVEVTRTALRINPEYTDAWNNLAIAYTLSGDRSAALNAARELRRLDPEKADKLFNLIVPR